MLVGRDPSLAQHGILSMKAEEGQGCRVIECIQTNLLDPSKTFLGFSFSSDRGGLLLKDNRTYTVCYTLFPARLPDIMGQLKSWSPTLAPLKYSIWSLGESTIMVFGTNAVVWVLGCTGRCFRSRTSPLTQACGMLIGFVMHLSVFRAHFTDVWQNFWINYLAFTLTIW